MIIVFDRVHPFLRVLWIAFNANSVLGETTKQSNNKRIAFPNSANCIR